MKKTIVVFSLGMLVVPALSLAANGVSLYNGGLGNVATNQSSFGVAVCNNGTQDLTAAVPVLVKVGMTSRTVASAPSIPVGACAYSYLAYSTFNMVPGGQYAVAVTIDPPRATIANTDNSATYTITVPGGSPAASGQVLGASVSAMPPQDQLAMIAQLLNVLLKQLQEIGR